MTPSGRETAGGRAVLLVLLVLVLLRGRRLRRRRGRGRRRTCPAAPPSPGSTSAAGARPRRPRRSRPASPTGSTSRSRSRSTARPLTVDPGGRRPLRRLRRLGRGGRRREVLGARPALGLLHRRRRPRRRRHRRRGRDDGDRRGPGRVGRHACRRTATSASRTARSRSSEPRPGEQVDRRGRPRRAGGGVPPGRRDGRARRSTPAQPDIDDADVQAALDEFANPAVSGPVTLVFGKSPVRLPPRDFAPALGMRAEDGELVPELDEEKLGELVEGRRQPRRRRRSTRRFRVVDGKPKVVPAKPGVSYQPEDVSDAFLDLVQRPSGEARAEGQGDGRGGRLHHRRTPAP